MVIVKATYTVQPAEPTPIEKMDISKFDQITAAIHTSSIYFNAPANYLLFSDAIRNLKDSLSKVLVIFYPLAGASTRSVEAALNSTAMPREQFLLKQSLNRKLKT
ncbi:Uncharacterized protein Fot_06412 [Forsythia ovata]|uniref:Uncharacterized protein n=1 Tax=Forsythia ovata TaxID=205694 RepID=A0ABD1WSX9_9LAMI